ncbi:hypothetical protein TRVL_09255 [Trypanosoma vivax]|nr:hypothetical protein TRVL_09255 [Trypanosoma vivax]
MVPGTFSLQSKMFAEQSAALEFFISANVPLSSISKWWSAQRVLPLQPFGEGGTHIVHLLHRIPIKLLNSHVLDRTTIALHEQFRNQKKAPRLTFPLATVPIRVTMGVHGHALKTIRSSKGLEEIPLNAPNELTPAIEGTARVTHHGFHLFKDIFHILLDLFSTLAQFAVIHHLTGSSLHLHCSPPNSSKVDSSIFGK